MFFLCCHDLCCLIYNSARLFVFPPKKNCMLQIMMISFFFINKVSLFQTRLLHMPRTVSNTSSKKHFMASGNERPWKAQLLFLIVAEGGMLSFMVLFNGLCGSSIKNLKMHKSHLRMKQFQDYASNNLFSVFIYIIQQNCS